MRVRLYDSLRFGTKRDLIDGEYRWVVCFGGPQAPHAQAVMVVCMLWCAFSVAI